MRCALLVVLALSGITGAAASAGCGASNDAPAPSADASADGATTDAPIFTGDATPPGCAPSAANFDIPGNACDDDNDGLIDNGGACDDGLPVTGDASLFARAIDLCRTVGDDAGATW